MKVNSFEDFKKANGKLVKHSISMKTNSGETIDLLVATVGVKARDMMQAQKLSMLDGTALKKGEAELKADLSKFRGDSTIFVSLGVINEDGKRYMDNDDARSYLDTEILPAELDKVSDFIEKISGLSKDSQASAEKNLKTVQVDG